MNKNHYIIPIFVPHVGCPNDCVFCNQRKITGISTDITGKDVREKIEDYLETIPKDDRVLEIAFFGGSFTGIDKEIQVEFLAIANGYKKSGIVNEIRLSTRPDYIDIDRLDILRDGGVDTIELGVQSMDEEVLLKSYRNHTVEDVYGAVKLIRDYGFKLGLQMMIGLPGDNLEKTIKTAKKLIGLKPDIARIYPTLVIRETQLEKDFIEGSYIPVSLEDGVYRSKLVLHMMRRNNIKVIRIGLQPSDNISEGSEDLVAGPFHPSFRQLVESEIYYDAIREKLKTLGNISKKIILVKVGQSYISYVSGQSGKNKKRLIEEFGLRNIRIEAGNIRKNKFEIAVLEGLEDTDCLLKYPYGQILNRYSEV